MESFEQILGRNLRIIRKQKGFRSQEALAEALGIERTTVARWETGISRPSPESMKAIQRVLGCGYADLVGESLPEPQTPVEEQLAALTQQIKALQSQIETMQPKPPTSSAGRHATGVYQYTPETIVIPGSESPRAKPQEPQPQSQREAALLEAFRSADAEMKETIEIGLGLKDYQPEPDSKSQAPAKHKNKA